MDWSQKGPADVNATTGWRLSEITPVDRTSSASSVYYERIESSWKLSVRFDVNNHLHLAAVNYSGTFDDIGTAEKIRLQLIDALKPGGLPTIDSDSFQYKWRSLDSHTLFDLTVRVIKGKGSARLFATLLHTAVDPASVDDLPFEKGFMGCVEQRRKTDEHL